MESIVTPGRAGAREARPAPVVVIVVEREQRGARRGESRREPER
jgi:hypothetical protein